MKGADLLGQPPLLAEGSDHLLGLSAELRIVLNLLVELESLGVVLRALIEGGHGESDGRSVLRVRFHLKILLEVLDGVGVLAEFL